MKRPLSGPTKSQRPRPTAIGRRSEPTPGSTTATKTVPGGKCRYAASSASAPAATSWAGTSWVTSTSVASGQTVRIAPFMAPT